MATMIVNLGYSVTRMALFAFENIQAQNGSVQPISGQESTTAVFKAEDTGNLEIQLSGQGFTYSNGALTRGTLTGLTAFPADSSYVAFTLQGFAGISAEEMMAILNGSDAGFFNLVHSNQWDFAGSAGGDDFASGEFNDKLSSGVGNDTFYADSNYDKVREKTGEGSDTVISHNSFTLHASAEIEFLQTANAAGALGFFLTGNGFAQTITGNAGSNSLKGLGGNDALIGRSGADKLYGGTGADTFIFQTIAQSTLSARDMIYDFSRVEADKIDLSAIDARATTAGNQAFTFLGVAELSGRAGERRYLKKDGDTYIHGDVNGDEVIDFSIRLDSAIDLKSTDFIL